MTTTLRAVPIEIKFNEISTNVDIAPTDIQVLRVGTFYDPRYGKVEITPLILAKMKENFDKKVRGVDLAVDYKHESDDVAAGWMEQLFLMGEGTELWATITWTPKGKRVLHDKEFRYVSADFVENYIDNESLVEFGHTLMGAGLTNRPVVKGMVPAVELQEIQNEKQMADLQAKTKGPVAASPSSEDKTKAQNQGGSQMSDVQAAAPAVAAPAAGMSPEEMMKMIEELKAKIASYEAQSQEMLAQKKMSEQKAKFDTLFKEGKACEAQRDAFMSGDTVKFAELAQPVKLTTVGDEATPPATGSDVIAEVMKLAEKKLSDQSAKDLGDAISMTLRENAELRKQYEALEA